MEPSTSLLSHSSTRKGKDPKVEIGIPHICHVSSFPNIPTGQPFAILSCGAGAVPFAFQVGAGRVDWHVKDDTDAVGDGLTSLEPRLHHKKYESGISPAARRLKWDFVRSKSKEEGGNDSTDAP